MAIYHCSVKIGSRGKGKSAVAASAYRAGDKLKDRETGEISDYTHKSGIIFSEISLCQNAPLEYLNREILWNEVHKIEKSKNAQLWREIEVALPKELNRENQIETVREYVKYFTDRGMCADWSLHDKKDGNPHAHIMLTTRSIREDGTWAPKCKKIYDLDENGEKIFQKLDKNGCKQYKCHKEDFNDWNNREKVEEWRKVWADCCNSRLKENERIDHRSYERQGIEKIPTIHEGYVARQIQASGRISKRIKHNETIKKLLALLNEIIQMKKPLVEEKQRIDDIERRNYELFNSIFSRADTTDTSKADRTETADSGTGKDNQFLENANNEISREQQAIGELKRIEEQQRLAVEAERKRKVAEEIARREREAREAYENQGRGGMSR